MKYVNHISNAFRGKSMNPTVVTAIVSGAALGLALCGLFMTRKGHQLRHQMKNAAENLFSGSAQRKRTIANSKLGEMIDDVRTHVKRNAEGLIGSSTYNNQHATLKTENRTTNALKEKPVGQMLKAKPAY